MGAYLLWEQVVPGSNPGVPTNFGEAMTQEEVKINVYRVNSSYASGESDERFSIEVIKPTLAQALYLLSRDQAMKIMEDLRLLLRDEQDPEEK